MVYIQKYFTLIFIKFSTDIYKIFNTITKIKLKAVRPFGKYKNTTTQLGKERENNLLWPNVISQV